MAAERLIRVKILVEAPGAAAAGNEAAGSLERVAGSADNAGKKSSAAGKLIGLAIAAGAVVATKAMLDLGMSYESSLNSLQAVSGASAAQMTQVSAAAKALGNDLSIPGASASDAAEAMTELAKGGLDVEEAMAAAKGTLQLAAAAQISGAQAATIQADSLNAFHLEASEAGRVADVLANAANAATGEISDFGQGLAQSSAVAYSMGVSLEDNVTALGLFANAGVKGSDAGTSFKTMLQSLQNPTLKAQAALDELGVTVYDAQGNFVGMRSVTDDLAKAKQRMSQEDFNAAASTVFGSDAVRAAQIIAEGGTAAWDDMSTALGQVGGAADLAGANSKGLKGALDTVKNAAETAALNLYEELSPALETATRGITDMIGPLAESLTPALAAGGLGLLDLVQAVEPLIPALVNALVPAITSVASAMVTFIPVIVPVVDALAEVLGWIAQLPEPILATAVAFGVLASTNVLTSIVTGIKGMVDASAAAGGAMAALGNKITAFFTSPAGIAFAAAAALATVIGLLVKANSSAAAATAANKQAVEEYSSTLDANTGAVTENTAATIANRLGPEKLAELRNLGVNTSAYTSAILGNAQAQALVKQQLEASAVAVLAQAEGIGYLTSTFNTAGVSAEQFAKAITGGGFDEINAQITAYNSTLGIYEDHLPLIQEGELGMEKALQAANKAVGPQKDALGLLGLETDRVATSTAEANEKILAASGALAIAGSTHDVFNDILGETASATDDAASAAEGLTTAGENLAPVTDGVTAALKDQKDAQDAASSSAEYLIVALLEIAGKDVSAEQAARANAAAMRDISQSARDQAEAVQNVADKQAELADVTAHLGDENKDTRTTVDDVAKAQRDLDTATAGVTAASDNQASALEKAAASASSMAAATFTSTLRTGTYEQAVVAATAEMQKQRDAFIAQQPAADIASGAAARLADTYGLIPENVRTAYDQVGGEEVARAAQEIIDKANALDGRNVRTTFTQTNTIINQTQDGGRANSGEPLRPKENGGIMPFANGGTLPGAYIAAANGLMRGVSAKVKGGANGPGVLWGEPQVGTEWYISAKQGQERRNEQFLANAAEYFGGSYTPSGAQDVAPPSGIQAANGYGPVRVNSPAVNMGGTTVFVEIDGQQLQGRIVSTVRSENSANNRAELAVRR